MPEDLSRILRAASDGDRQASEQLLPLVYDALRSLAHQRMARERPGQTLQATALVHEAYLRLVSDEDVRWANRRHFFGAASEAMRRILVERARRKARIKHGGEHERVFVEESDLADPRRFDELLGVDEALEKLAARHPRKAEIVKLRYFIGLGVKECAELLEISPETVKRDWRYARAWLHRALSGEDAA